MEMIQVRRKIAAGREWVWAAWTSPGLLVRWYGPEAKAEADPRVGGRYRLSMRESWGDLVAIGEYREVAPPERLVFTWRWEEGGGPDQPMTQATVELHATAGGTELVLTHTGLPDGRVAAKYEEGWSDCLERLAALARVTQKE